MRILLTTLNAKYVHFSLALAYLKAYCSKNGRSIQVREYTINESIDDIMASIYLLDPQVLCISCYIWNIRMVLEVCHDFKKVAPSTVIILGGPEVSHNSVEVMKANPSIDFIVKGEGEQTLDELLQILEEGGTPGRVNGITYRQSGEIVDNPERQLIPILDTIPFPYENSFQNYQNRIIYYETSRGCPFNCSYCLSCTLKTLRYFSLERVKRDLAYLMKQEPETIKFVDRTFNCNEKRACEIMEFIIHNRGNTKFHLEICADLLSEAMLEFLHSVPPGIFDFEIGVQSTNLATLEAVNRKSNWKRLSKNIRLLKEFGNIHLHLDLIAGLPFEDRDLFAISFNDVYGLEPDVIQMGFLKILKGSDIEKCTEKYEYRYQAHPPYRVLSNRWLSFGDVVQLTKMEELLNRYYNTGMARNTLRYITGSLYNHDSFSFFHEFSVFWEQQNLYGLGHKRENEYSYLKRFIDQYYPQSSLIINELIKYDFLLNNRAYNLPAGIVSWEPDFAQKVLKALITDAGFVAQHLNHLKDKSIRERKKHVSLEFFSIDPEKTSAYSPGPVPKLFIYHPVKKKALKTVDIPNWRIFI
jgi:radical SAM superfamily enzyme YgiQ (UPF0313 family)